MRVKPRRSPRGHAGIPWSNRRIRKHASEHRALPDCPGGGVGRRPAARAACRDLADDGDAEPVLRRHRPGDDGDGGAAGLALALARRPVRRPGPRLRSAQVAGCLGAGAGVGAPGVQGRDAGLGRGRDPAAAALLDAPGAPAQLRGAGADRAAGAQPQDSLRPVALVAQAVRAAVRGRGAALAQLQVADRPGIAGRRLAGAVRGPGPGGRGLQTAAVSVSVRSR